ncbi:MAG: iron ABC transporter permease [Nitrospirae bacterium]|nr:MAG: iron ABC transporter permease [Nitrospirota bacterium]
MKLLIVISLFLMIVVALLQGSVDIDFFHMTQIQRDILIHVRLPRVLMAAVVGASLSLSGTLLQYVMKNPLADSFTTGISASSAMGAVFAIMLGLSYILPIFALFGGLIGLIVVYKISSVGGRIQPITMLLAGIVMNTFCSAVISFVKFLSDDSVSSIVFWLMGGFQNSSIHRVITLFILLCIIFLSIRKDYLSMDILCFDDTTALASGVDVSFLRKKIFFSASLLTAFCVGYAGIIGFVGLIVPHIMRLIKFVKAEELIPICLFGGAFFMVLNDLVSRTILPEGQELPVGIITSSIGGLFFLYLLLKRRKELYYFA